MTIFDDFEKLAHTELPQILAIFGDDDDIVSELRERFLSAVSYDAAHLSQSYYDLSEASVSADSALEDLESLPFFDDRHLVIFENLWNLTTTRKSVFSDKEMARLEAFLDNPVETTQFVLFLHGKLDSRLKLSKKLRKVATCLETPTYKNAQEKARYVSQLFNQSGLTRPVLNRVLEKSNYSFAMTKQNIALLKTYVGQRDIQLDDVEKVVPKSLQDQIFDLSDLIFSHQTAAARELVADLTLLGTDVVQILAFLVSAVRFDLRVKLLSDKGLTQAEVTRALAANPYRVKFALPVIRKLSSNYLKKALKLLIELDYQIKTSVADKHYLFDVTLIKLSST